MLFNFQDVSDQQLASDFEEVCITLYNMKHLLKNPLIGDDIRSIVESKLDAIQEKRNAMRAEVLLRMHRG